MRWYTHVLLLDDEMLLIMADRKLHPEENSIALDHHPQKHVLRTGDDVKLELVASVLMTESHNVEGSPLLLPSNQTSTSVQAHDWPCRPKCTLWNGPFVWLAARAANPSHSRWCDRIFHVRRSYELQCLSTFEVGVTHTYGRSGKVHYCSSVETRLMRTPHHVEHPERGMI